MREKIAVFALIFLIGQGIAAADSITQFKNGNLDEEIFLETPAYTQNVNLSLPADQKVLAATMDISSMLADSETSGTIDRLQLSINDTLVWEFSGKDYGMLGRQEAFLNDAKTVTARFPASGGNQTASILMMKNATVMNATMNVQCSGPGGLEPSYSFIGTGEKYGLGGHVSDVGDVNADGFDDVVIGESSYTENGDRIGRAYIYYGGLKINKSADVILAGNASFRYFGCSVSGAGDVNGDGYDDVIIGCHDGNVTYSLPSKAYIYFGGPDMDSVPDVILNGTVPIDEFGFAVSRAGDLNDDSYDDVIVGAYYTNDSTGNAYIYYGGPNVDNIADIILSGADKIDSFGYAVSNAGDVNADGFDDVIVGAQFNDSGGSASGRAYVFYGGDDMDANADVIFTGSAAGEYLGTSVSDAGDVNKDGYDDVIVGTESKVYLYNGGANMDSVVDLIITRPAGGGAIGWRISSAGDVNKDGYDDIMIQSAGGDSYPGNVYIYLGRGAMENNPDITFSGENNGDHFGNGLSSAGDIDNDGFDDIIIGAPGYDSTVVDVGAFYIYSHGSGGLHKPNITIAAIGIWEHLSYFNGNDTTMNFATMLNDYLKKAQIADTDDFGNSFINVPLRMAARGEGNITLDNLNITYKYKTTIPDFADVLNSYVGAHKKEKDTNGNITVPIKITSRSSGKVRLLNLKIILDAGLKFIQKIPDVDLKEDSIKADLLDLSRFFKDDNDPSIALEFQVNALTNGSYVNVTVVSQKYLSADAQSGPMNDNWTGEVTLVAKCTNTRNQTRESNEFRIIVTNVNDPPIFTSTPVTAAIAEKEYVYQVAAVDGDNDTILFNLTKSPQNMTIDPVSGLIKWIPPKGGGYEVTIGASDGQVTNIQNYIIVVPNRPPRITDLSVPAAYLGVQFTYDIPATDDDGNELNFGLLSVIPGMTIDPNTGRITWIPDHPGDFPVSVRISDRKDTTIYNFTIKVGIGNRNPKISTNPILSATTGVPYYYDAEASDEDGDPIVYAIVVGPPGMTINGTSGKISWTPTIAGRDYVKLKAYDGNGGEALQEFTITVVNRTRPGIEFKTPSEGQKVKGRFLVTGTAIKGTLDIIKIQLRVDSGEWLDASGTATWTYALDTTKLKDGRHTLQARAFDGMDYSEILNRTVAVDNQKAAGKGFIPGFDAMVLVTVIMTGILISFRRRRSCS